MAVENTRFTPGRRGPDLSDGAGGTSDRPVSRTSDPVLRDVGHKTEMIRLIPAGTDVSAGEGVFYDVGKVDKLSVGRYRLTRQTAASATAEPLGDFAYLDFDIYENTAGVFVAVTSPMFETEGGTATNDAADTDVQATDATLVAVADATLDGAGSDSRVTVFVATAADVTDAAAWTAAATLVQGNLYILDAEEADDHVFTITRLT
jgi:hypothetical protein